MKKSKRKKIKLSVNDINNILDRMQELADTSLSGEEKDTVTLSEMAAFLKVTPTTLKKYVINNEIPGYFAANKKIYFLRSDFEADLFSPGKMLTCPDVAQKLKVDPRTVRRWIANGLLAAQKIGKQWWINYDDYLDFLELGHCMYE